MLWEAGACVSFAEPKLWQDGDHVTQALLGVRPKDWSLQSRDDTSKTDCLADGWAYFPTSCKSSALVRNEGANEWDLRCFWSLVKWLQSRNWWLLWPKCSWELSYPETWGIRRLGRTSGNSFEMDGCVSSCCGRPGSESEYKTDGMLFYPFQTNDFVLSPSPPHFISSSITSARGQPD